MAYALSVAAAEAEAAARGVPLCRAIDPASSTLPYPIGNVIGGGKHASERSPSLQEIMVCPVGAVTVKEAITLNLEVHKRVGRKLSKTLNYPLGRGDEGGWAPGITDEEAIRAVSETAAEVQDEKGKRIRVGVDVAADSLYDKKKGAYYYRATQKTLQRDGRRSRSSASSATSSTFCTSRTRSTKMISKAMRASTPPWAGPTSSAMTSTRPTPNASSAGSRSIAPTAS